MFTIRPPRRLPRFAGAGDRLGRMVRACGVLLVVAATVTGCGGPGDGGYQVNPSSSVIAGGDSTGVGVPTEFPAILAIPKFDVALVSASLLPLPGYPAPKLIHVGVWKITHGMAGMAWYWPPREMAGQKQPGVQSAPWVGGAPLAGYRLPPHPPVRVIYYSVVASRPGDYYAAGLRIRYRVGVTVYTGNLYSGGAMCARVHWQASAPANQCDVWARQAFSKLADMAKGS